MNAFFYTDKNYFLPIQYTIYNADQPRRFSRKLRWINGTHSLVSKLRTQAYESGVTKTNKSVTEGNWEKKRSIFLPQTFKECCDRER